MKLKREENRGDTTLIEIIIPSYITEIEDASFEGCMNLEEITFLPDSQLKSIGKNAFRNCKKLRKIIFPEKVERIGVSAFRGCESLEKVIFRNNVVPSKTISSFLSFDIGNDAFRGCIKLKSITIPYGVKKISCFRDCSLLSSITIPDSVEEIGDRAFDSCINLDINPINISQQNKIRRIGNFAFNRCSNLKVQLFNFLFPKLESIGNFAFARCYSLEIIDIPIAVHTIGHNCFTGCVKLEWVNNLPLKLKKISICCFSGCKRLYYIQIPDGVEEIEMNSFSGCLSIESIKIPDSVKVIGKYAFSNCHSLKTAVLPENLRSVNVGLFCGCFEMESVYLGPHITAIHRYAFYGCKLKNLTNDNTDEMIIPENIGFIGQSSFYACRMKKLVVSSKIILEDYAFSSCENLTTAIIQEKSILHGNYIFILCKKLVFLTVGSHVKMSGINIFDSSVKFVMIGENVDNPHNYFANNKNRIGTYQSLKKYNVHNFTSCPISRDDFEDDTEVVLTSCCHIFSKDSFELCIDKLRCPMCRAIY